MRTYSTATEGSEGKKEEAAASAGGSEAERIASLEARVKELEVSVGVGQVWFDCVLGYISGGWDSRIFSS